MSYSARVADPVEVGLVEAVKGCRTCSWFWEGVPPYGPYPAYDWKQQFPGALPRAEKLLPDAEIGRPWLTVDLLGAGFPDPALMRGCRKAPIMTIGINPNLAAWSPGAKSAPIVYPAFKDLARYAYYHRYVNIYQESLSIDLVRRSVDTSDCLEAEDDGFVVALTRESAHSYCELTVRYSNRPVDTTYEIAWRPDARWIVLQNVGKAKEPATWFKKGELLAGRFDPPSAVSENLFLHPSTYYQRMLPVLDRFKDLTGLQHADLTIGEDVAQHDMVSCASPGWQQKYDMPMDRISANCVSRNGWLVLQFLQSQPVVVILVGLEALRMFRTAFGNYMTLQDSNDVYHLLTETCRRPNFVTINVGCVNFRSRLLVSPHFSYDDGFAVGIRISSKAWAAFESDFPTDANVLKANGRLVDANPAAGPPEHFVDLARADALRDQLTASGQSALEGYFVDPYESLAHALAMEHSKHELAFDQQTGHLVRGRGPCRFCDNSQWTFPQGCPYGKPVEPSLASGDIQRAAQSVLESSQNKASAPSVTTSAPSLP